MHGNVAGAAASICAWCEASLEPAGERRLVPCAACGAATTSPWPTADELDSAYAGGYRPDAGRFAGPGDAVLRWSRSRLARHLHRVAPPGPVLDVGAGDGALLDALARHGRSGVGLEREATRADLRDVDVLDVGGSWAAVVFWHSLEHLPGPGRALRHAAGLLAPGGRLVLAVPNVESLQARLFGERWFHVDAPRHLVHLPASGIVRTLEDADLRVVSVSHTRGGQVLFGWLHGLVGALPGSLDLYDAVRRPEARTRPMSRHRRVVTLAAGVVALPVAVVAAAVEVVCRRGGTVRVEAVRD